MANVNLELVHQQMEKVIKAIDGTAGMLRDTKVICAMEVMIAFGRVGLLTVDELHQYSDLIKEKENKK